MVGHIRRTNIVLVLAVMSGVRPGASAEPSRPASVVFNTVTAAVSERVEGRIVWPGRVFENPYDPACVSLDAVIEGPVGRRVYPCFYRVPVTADGVEAAAGEWVFRHAFRMEGAYRVSFRLVGGGVTAVTPPHAIEVAGRRPGGFVRPDPARNGVWLRDDGVRLFASGLNAAWSEGADREPYRDLLARCAAAGVGFMRVWMIGFAAQELEWSEELWTPWNAGYGLGRYNQRVAAFFDWLFEEAGRMGGGIQLVLETDGEWSRVVDPNWEFNPYNAAHGGFLDSPDAFFTDPEARRRARARYRYCVARWGAEPALAAWELFNEADQTDAVKTNGEETAVAAWHQEQACFIQKLDAVPRPVVSSATDPDFLKRLVRAAPALDRLDLHLYRDDAVRAAEAALRDWREGALPAGRTGLYCAEFGVSGESEIEPEDPARVRGLVRRMTWRGRLAGVPAWYWFWKKAEAAGAWEVNRAVAAVFAEWDWAAARPVDAEAAGGPPVARYTVTPEWGWAVTLTNRHRVAYDGATHRVLRGQSSYLQGAWQASMGRALILEADFLQGGAFEALLAGVSPSGKNELAVRVDGVEVWRRQVRNGLRLLTQVGGGRHTIELRNTGEDWLRVGEIAVARPAEAAAEAVAAEDGRRVVAYVADKRFLAGCGEGIGVLEGVALRLEGLTDARTRFRARFIHPADGAGLGAIEGLERGEDGALTVPLPPFTDDLAVLID